MAVGSDFECHTLLGGSSYVPTYLSWLLHGFCSGGCGNRPVAHHHASSFAGLTGHARLEGLASSATIRLRRARGLPRFWSTTSWVKSRQPLNAAKPPCLVLKQRHGVMWPIGGNTLVCCLNRPVFCIRSGWWLGPDRRWMLTVVRVFGSVAPLRYVGQRGEPAARTHQGEHHDRYRSWELVRCTCRKSPSISQACGGMFTAMTTSSKTRGTTARKKEIGRGSIHFSTSPTSGTIKMQPIVFEVASC